VTGTATFDGSANATIAATIAANSVITADIADSAVTSAKIANLSVTDAKLANTLDLTGKTVSLAASAIPNNSVTSAKISDASVGFSKLDSTLQTQLVRAYVGFDGTGANGAKTMREAVGISGVTQNNAGDYTISFTGLINTQFVSFGTCSTPGTSWGIVDVFGVTNMSLRIITRNSAGSAAQYSRVDIMILKTP
jgi:hypothetical protein